MKIEGQYFRREISVKIWTNCWQDYFVSVLTNEHFFQFIVSFSFVDTQNACQGKFWSKSGQNADRIISFQFLATKHCFQFIFHFHSWAQRTLVTSFQEHADLSVYVLRCHFVVICGCFVSTTLICVCVLRCHSLLLALLLVKPWLKIKEWCRHINQFLLRGRPNHGIYNK